MFGKGHTPSNVGTEIVPLTVSHPQNVYNHLINQVINYSLIMSDFQKVYVYVIVYTNKL